MYEYCGDCEYLGRKDNETYKDFWSGETKYKCRLNGNYKKVNDSSCGNIRKIERKNEGYQPSGCYITTIVCDMLGFPDDCFALTTLREFRNNYLRSHEEYHSILVEYDLVGPEISKMLGSITDKRERVVTARNLFKGFIAPCVSYINNNEYDSAIETYKAMVNYLMNIYDIVPVELESIDDYDFSKSGTGNALKRVKKDN